MKNYLLRLLESAVPAREPNYGFGQDAIEWAIVTGAFKPMYDLTSDARNLMLHYDVLVEAYQQALQNQAALTPSYAPLLRQIEGRAA